MGNCHITIKKIYHAGAKPQFNTDIEGKPNTLAGYGIGNFKVEEFRGNLNELLTALEQEIEQWQFPT